MKIGELAASSGVTAKTVRFYEEAGLLPKPPRLPSGYRSYGQSDVDRLRFVRQAKRLGLSLEEIRETLGLHDADEPTCTHVRGLIDQKLARVDRVLADLRKFRTELLALRERAGTMDDCRPSGGNVCGIIERNEIALSVEGLNWITAGQGDRTRRKEGH